MFMFIMEEFVQKVRKKESKNKILIHTQTKNSPLNRQKRCWTPARGMIHELKGEKHKSIVIKKFWDVTLLLGNIIKTPYQK